MAKRPPKTDSSKSNSTRVSEIVKQYRSFFDVTVDLRANMKEDQDFCRV